MTKGPIKPEVREMANAVNSSLDLLRVMAERGRDDDDKQTRLATAATCVAVGLLGDLIVRHGHDQKALLAQFMKTVEDMMPSEIAAQVVEEALQ